MAVKILSGKVFLVITGASQGLGREMAIQFGQLLSKGSQVLLIARDSDRLKSTVTNLPKYLEVTYESVDLSLADTDVLDGILKKHLAAKDVANFNRAVIVHNAATSGDLQKKATDLMDFEELRQYFHLNVFSPIVLNGIFMKIFNDETKVERLVINITSLCAYKTPIRSVTFYGPGKAAREMFFKLLAVQFPQVNVLNYSPGLLDTNMYDNMIRTFIDVDDLANYSRIETQGILVTPEQSVERLIVVLREQKYKSGDCVDYDAYK